MKTGMRKLRRAFTLLELTIVMMVGLMIGSMIIAIFNQQLAFLRMYRIQSFITEEAPMVSVYMNSLISKADRYRLHLTIDDALNGTDPQIDPSPVCVLNFRQPDGTMRASILSFEDLGNGPELNYYVVPQNGLLGTPQWSITERAANVSFSMEQGILRTTLTGPEGEQITYSGSIQ